MNKKIILYPTETTYALGVNVLDGSAWSALCNLKQRRDSQPASWLVRDIADIEHYAKVDEATARLVAKFMPGPITLALPANQLVPEWAKSDQGLVSFRISADKKAQTLIADFMKNNQAPLTCTSANLHKMPTASEPEQILSQFADQAKSITQVIDDGPRQGAASTVVAFKNNQLTILRAGPIAEEDLLAVLK